MTESELRFEEGRALFVVRTDRGAYADALRQLAFQDADGEFTRPFAPDAPDLERIYRRFSDTLELLLRQTARLAPTPWAEGLRVLAERLEGSGLAWFLAGSAALAVRGVDVAPRDLDIVVDDASRLGELLDDALIHPLVHTPGSWIADWFGRAFLHCRI